MQYLFVFALLALASCSLSEKKNNIQQPPIDTSSIIKETLHQDTTSEKQSILNNCLMIDNDKLAVVVEGSKKELRNDEELIKILKENSGKIRGQKFSIIYSQTTSGKKIKEVLQIIKDANILNYKTLPLEEIFQLNEPNSS